jgi:urease accessory protein
VRLTAYEIRREAAPASAPDDHVTLDYADRFLRRKTLRTAAGNSLFVDLPETLSLDEGDAFFTTDGRHIAVAAAPEALIEITAPPGDLARLAWHIGNRHTPARIETGRILVRAEPVMADMLARLGATTREITAPFAPEGGAYGLGRTHGHDHEPHD